MLNPKLELLELTKAYLNRPDLIQGPGGNTSFKNSEGEMYIKASGFKFEEMSLEKGISAVNYLNINNYFKSVQPLDKEIEEKKMLNLIQESILIDNLGMKYPKPSMETGFHAVLSKYVVHTHSVWTNLINCSKNSQQYIALLKEILGVEIAEIPFVSPGFGLSYLVTQAIKNAEVNKQSIPQLFFLANHGVIAHANELKICNNLLFELDKAIQELLNISSDYPNTEIVELSEGFWKPKEDFIQLVLQKYQVNESFFNQVLFPDQTVFFNHQIDCSGNASDKKIQILPSYAVQYKCSKREAYNINETLTAYLFLYDNLKQNEMEIALIEGSEVDYINNMEMEKHRKNIQ